MEQVQEFRTFPQPQSSRLIDFERAEVRVLESDPPRYLLVVEGTKPCINMRVQLVPVVYIDRPEYWSIEVIGNLPGGICLPALGSYEVDLLDPPTGTRGIEVVGATRRETIDVPTDREPKGSFVLSITSKTTGKLIATASLTCSPDGGSHPHVAAACEQLTNASGCIEGITPDEGPCPRQFDPVILKASGTWHGKDRRFHGEFANLCVGVRETGGTLFKLESVKR